MNNSEKHASEYSEDQLVLIQAKDLKPGHWFCRGFDNDRPLFNAYYVSSPVHQLETSVIFFIEMSQYSGEMIVFNPNPLDNARVKEHVESVEFDEVSQIKSVSLQITFQPPDTPMYVLKPEFAPILSQEQKEELEEQENLEWRFGILSVGDNTTIEEMKKTLEDIISNPSPRTGDNTTIEEITKTLEDIINNPSPRTTEERRDENR